VGIQSKLHIHGDFEITLSYQLVAPERPSSGYGAGIMMWVMLDAKPGIFGAVARRSPPKGPEVFNSSFGSFPEGKIRQVLKPFPASAREGQLRLVREGTTLKYMVKEPQDADFRTFRVETDFSDAPVKHSKFGADRGLSSDPLDVVLREFTIRADELSHDLKRSSRPASGAPPAPTAVTDSTTPPESRSYTALWVVCGGMVLLVLGGAWFWLRRKAEEDDQDDEEEDE
jgi:hypothetical protein